MILEENQSFKKDGNICVKKAGALFLSSCFFSAGIKKIKDLFL